VGVMALAGISTWPQHSTLLLGVYQFSYKVLWRARNKFSIFNLSYISQKMMIIISLENCLNNRLHVAITLSWPCGTLGAGQRCWQQRRRAALEAGKLLHAGKVQ